MSGFPHCCQSEASTPCAPCTDYCPNGCGPDNGLSIYVEGINNHSTGEQCGNCTDFWGTHLIANDNPLVACAGSSATRGCSYFSTLTTGQKYYYDRNISWQFGTSTEVGKDWKLTVDIWTQRTASPGGPFDLGNAGGGRYIKHYTSTEQCDSLSSDVIPYDSAIAADYWGSFESTSVRCVDFSTALVKVSSY